MAITDSWLKANNKKERSKTIVKTDRDGLSARVSKANSPIAFAIITMASKLEQILEHTRL